MRGRFLCASVLLGLRRQSFELAHVTQPLCADGFGAANAATPGRRADSLSAGHLGRVACWLRFFEANAGKRPRQKSTR